MKLDRFISGGQTIGTMDDGKKAMVWGGLPGEKVEIDITKKKKSYVEGIVSRVVSASSHRVAPRDEAAYLSTSPWQIMDYEYELEQKAQLIREAFLQEHIEIEAPDIVTDGKVYEYRNKMEYSLWWDGETGQISLAFHRRGSHMKVPIDRSSIERPEVLAEAQRVVKHLNDTHDEARRYQSLVVRCSQKGEVSSGLFENGKPHPVMKSLDDELLGRKFSYSPNGFFQINLPVYELALAEIKKYILTDKVLDMYSGVGTIGLSIASDKDLTLVEVDKSAYEEMVQNADGAKNAKTVLAKSEEALEYIQNDATVVIDPPRAGLDEKVVQKICEVLPPTVIYLSCNPTTQARDVKMLNKYFNIEAVCGFNFFPRTPHIENLVVLKRK